MEEDHSPQKRVAPCFTRAWTTDSSTGPWEAAASELECLKAQRNRAESKQIEEPILGLKKVERRASDRQVIRIRALKAVVSNK